MTTFSPIPDSFIVNNNCIIKSNPKYDVLTYQQLLDLKKLTPENLKKEWDKMIKAPSDKNRRTFVGNKILYHFQFEELLKTKRDIKDYKTIDEILSNKELSKKWIDYAIKLNRNIKKPYLTSVDIFECYRLCKGSVVFFKPFTTKYLCTHFKATAVLDPCAGWGGRLLGARSLGLEYTGIDTNINLKKNYDKMLELYGGTMLYENCLESDFSTINYDIVITSPPYLNIEQYSHMPLFQSESDYYKDFLIPLIKQCKEHIKKPGIVCINISNTIYKKYLTYGGEPCNEDLSMELKQQMGGKKNKEVIYVWKCSN
tara:strand:+ start:1492 stop:2430 length:939 start_codon:yes stop_codon:yes gene_type:complete